MRLHPTFYVGHLKAIYRRISSRSVLAVHGESVQQLPLQQSRDLALPRPTREHHTGRSSPPQRRHEESAIRATSQATSYVNQRSSPGGGFAVISSFTGRHIRGATLDSESYGRPRQAKVSFIEK